MDELVLGKIKYVAWTHSGPKDVLVHSYGCQVGEGISELNTKALQERGFLTGDMECELVLRKVKG